MERIIQFRTCRLGLMISLLSFLTVIMPISCATVGKPGDETTDPYRMHEIITAIQGIEHSLQWVAPIACGVIAIAMDPAAAAACKVAQAAQEALILATNRAVSDYQGNPTPENAEAVTDMLARLKDAWQVMDAAYKGDPSKLIAQDKESRLHPSAWKRVRARVYPLSFGPTSAQAADCKFSWKAVPGASGYALEYS